jgi:hypothetical protein
MKNRKQLWGVIGGVILVAGALAGWRAWQGHQVIAGQWPDLDGGVYSQAVTKQGLQYLVPPNEIYTHGLSADDRPVLSDPAMVNIATADSKLADDLSGISIVVDGQAYFYPFQVLNWHEIVNADFNGKKLVITYSALTGSAVVYDTDKSFVSAGQVYNNALLIKTADSETVWNQTSGQAIVGKEVGEYLPVYPSQVLSWLDWKDAYLNGLALSVDTGYAFEYGRHPYASYETSTGIFFPLNHTQAGIQPKDLVYRVETGCATDQPLVYLARYVPGQTDTNVDFGSGDCARSVVAFYDEDTDSVRVFSRVITRDDEQPIVLHFEQAGDVITDKETGSRWSATGVAISGDLRGTALTEMSVTRHYAFAQFAMFPKSQISGQELLPTAEVVPEGEVLEIN